VRQQIDPDAERLEVVRALGDVDVESLLRECERRGQPADAGACDENGCPAHDSTVRELGL